MRCFKTRRFGDSVAMKTKTRKNNDHVQISFSNTYYEIDYIIIANIINIANYLFDKNVFTCVKCYKSLPVLI